MDDKNILFIYQNFNFSKIFLPYKNEAKVKLVWCGSDLTAQLAIAQLKDWANLVVVDENLVKKLPQESQPRIISYSTFKNEFLPDKSFYEVSILHSSIRVAFYPSSDTHVKTFLAITEHISDYIFFVPPKKNEGVRDILTKNGIGWQYYSEANLLRSQPDILVVSNDWGREEKIAISEARKKKIPTVCIQEGCLDFTPAWPYRMEWVDFAFIQGPIMTKLLDRSVYFITGNPRFDSLYPLKANEKPLAMINLNFTYGIHEESKMKWINDAVSACQEIGLPFFVSQHPRDKSFFPDLPVKKSSPEVIHNQLSNASILITRFSTLVYEVMLLGKQVVYYNPHNEKMRLFNEDKTGGIKKAYDRRSLKNVLIQIMERQIDKELKENFIHLHCAESDRQAAKRCAVSLEFLPSLYKHLKLIDIREENLLYLKTKNVIVNIFTKLRMKEYFRKVFRSNL